MELLEAVHYSGLQKTLALRGILSITLSIELLKVISKRVGTKFENMLVQMFAEGSFYWLILGKFSTP